MAFKEFKEHSVRAGYGTLLAYMKSSESKYHALSAVESMPAIFGSPETIEYSTTTNSAITNVMGKKTTEQIEIELPYNIDNINICNDIKEDKVKYAYIDLDDFTAVEFTAEADYHVADIGTSDIKKLILTLTITDAKNNVTKDVYDLYMDTITFDDNFKSAYTLSSTNTDGISIKIATEPSTANITVESTSTGIINATYTNGALKVVPVAKGSASVKVLAKLDDYADNRREIKFIVED